MWSWSLSANGNRSHTRAIPDAQLKFGPSMRRQKLFFSLLPTLEPR